MKIFINLLIDWKDLQNKCAKILIDSEFNADIEKEIDTIKGKVSVDLFC